MYLWVLKYATVVKTTFLDPCLNFQTCLDFLNPAVKMEGAVLINTICHISCSASVAGLLFVHISHIGNEQVAPARIDR